MFQELFVAGEVGDAVKALLQVGVGGDAVGHLAVVELLVGHHVEVAGAGEAEDDSFCLARLLALESFVNGDADGVAALRGGQDALDAGKLLCCLKDAVCSTLVASIRPSW